MMTSLMASVLSMSTFGNPSFLQSFASKHMDNNLPVDLNAPKEVKDKKKKKVEKQSKEKSDLELMVEAQHKNAAEAAKQAKEDKKKAKEEQKRAKEAQKTLEKQNQEEKNRKEEEKTHIDFTSLKDKDLRFSKKGSNNVTKSFTLNDDAISVIDYQFKGNDKIVLTAVSRLFQNNKSGEELEAAFEEKLKKLQEISGYSMEFVSQGSIVKLNLSMKKKSDLLITAIRSENLQDFIARGNKEGLLEIEISFANKCKNDTNVRRLIDQLVHKRLFSPIAIMKAKNQLEFDDMENCMSVAHIGKGFSLVLESQNKEAYPYVSTHLPKGNIEIRQIYPCEYAVKKAKCDKDHTCGASSQGIKTDFKDLVGFNLKTKNSLPLNPSKDRPVIFGQKVMLFTNQEKHQERLLMGNCNANVIAKKVLKEGSKDQYENVLIITKDQKSKGKKNEQIELAQVFKKFGQAFHEVDFKDKEQVSDHLALSKAVKRTFNKEPKVLQMEESESVSSGILATLSVVGATGAYTTANAVLEKTEPLSITDEDISHGKGVEA